MSKVDVTQYKWFQYDENAQEITFDQDRHNREYVLELHGGNVYGIKKRAHGIFVIHKNTPDIVFSLNEQEYNRIMAKSRGWTGKIRRVAVQAGEGWLDKPQDQMPKGWVRMEVDSSNLNTVIYDKTNKVLYVAFHNGASWAYENVSLKEYKEMEAAESRGRFFIYRIKYVKTQYKLGNNFDTPPYDVSPQGPSVKPVAKEAPNPEAKTPKAPAAKAPVAQETSAPPTVVKNPTKARPIVLRIPKGALGNWLGSEEGSLEDRERLQKENGAVHTGRHAFEILKSGKIESEQDVLTLLRSLTTSTLISHSKRAYNTAAIALLKATDGVTISAKNKELYAMYRRKAEQFIKDTALSHM